MTPPLLLFGDRHPPPDLLRARHGPTVLLARFEFRADVQPFHRSELRARFRGFRRGEVQAANEGRGRVSASFRGRGEKRMDSIRSTRRVDALHHAAQLLQASLCDADGVLLLDGDEESGRHGRVLLRVREQVPLRPRRPQKRHDCWRAQEWVDGKIRRQRRRKRPLRENARFSRVTTRPRRLPLSTARPTRASRTDMRSSRYSPVMLSLTAVALLLACAPVDAAVRVRPVTSLVVLDGVPARTFRRRDVRRDFCRAWTSTIGLDEKVRPRVSPAHVRERRIAR